MVFLLSGSGSLEASEKLKYNQLEKLEAAKDA